MRRTVPVAAFALIGFLSLGLAGGCTSRSDSDEAIFLDIPGPVAIHVESFNGDVDIEADEKLAEARVEVERKADMGYQRRGDSEESLGSIQYSVTLESTETGPVLMVRTWSDHPESYRQAATVKIRLPAAEGVTVHTTRGRVDVLNCQGAVDISTTNGDVRYMTNWPATQPVRITNSDGSIDFRVRGESLGTIDATATGGNVRHRVTHGLFNIRSVGIGSLGATLNRGENPIILTTEDADIRIAVVPNPTEVGIYIVDP